MSTEKFDIEAMRQRLDDEIKRQRRSRTEVSEASGNSAGYLTNILTRGQTPAVDKLDAVCRELGKSVSWAMYGIEIPTDFQEVFDLMAENPKKFYALLALMK